MSTLEKDGLTQCKNLKLMPSPQSNCLFKGCVKIGVDREKNGEPPTQKFNPEVLAVELPINSDTSIYSSLKCPENWASQVPLPRGSLRRGSGIRQLLSRRHNPSRLSLAEVTPVQWGITGKNKIKRARYCPPSHALLAAKHGRKLGIGLSTCFNHHLVCGNPQRSRQ